MADRGRELLTVDERFEYIHIRPNMSEWELATYYTFTEHDIELINQHRRDHNRLGFAVQLCTLRYPGWSLANVKEIPASFLLFIAKQINVDPEVFPLYAQREPTRREHMEEIRKEYGYQNFAIRDYRTSSQHLKNCAQENTNSIFLINSVIEFLRKQKVILPAMTTIERMVWESRNRAEQRIFKLLNNSLTELQKEKLDKLIDLYEEKDKTPLAWLKEIPGQPSPEAFLKIIKKLEYIKDLRLDVNTSTIHSTRLIQLARIGARYEPFSFRRFKEDKRYAILVAYLLNLSQDLIDLAIEIHDRQIVILQSKGRKTQEEMQKQNGKSINEKVIIFADIGTALIKAKNEGLDPFATIEKVMSWEDIVTSVEDAKKLARPMDYDYLDLLETKFNIGLSKMADATPGITYHQMANTVQWRLYDDAMLRAQATLVNFQHKLKLSSFWGDGSTSSSDGMRVQVGVSSLHAEANPHYGTGKGATMYRFVSDQFSTFYTKVINTNTRDAVHVIDGLLHHETDLTIEEHYTDTAGYTDQVFGLSHLLRFRFAPRLRDLSDAKLYKIDKSDEFSNIENLLRGKINMKIIHDNYDDVLRLAHSIREGKVSGSLIMGKLGSYSRQNSLATALREMGRIEKTIFILDYISSESMRRGIQRGLNKGEAMNALARALFFGKRGELRERALQDQLQRASALNILINAISIWNTVYLSEAIKVLRDRDGFNEDLLKHISPLGWEHINFLGEYRFNTKGFSSLDSLRPLQNTNKGFTP